MDILAMWIGYVVVFVGLLMVLTLIFCWVVDFFWKLRSYLRFVRACFVYTMAKGQIDAWIAEKRKEHKDLNQFMEDGKSIYMGESTKDLTNPIKREQQ